MPRYHRADDLIRLILELQATNVGLSIDDIADRFGVDRRTAERMRDRVVEIYPEAQTELRDGKKYWSIPGGLSRTLVRWEAHELAALETAVELAERDNRPDHGAALRSLLVKLQALMRPSRAAVLSTDTAALVEGEGLAMRPGPRPRIRTEVLDSLRAAVLACQKVRLHYARRQDGEDVKHKVYPYGFLYGHRHYLVAYSRPAQDFRLYSLANIDHVQTFNEYFERDADFDLRRFATNSFGIFQEKPRDVVWRFAPRVADDARQYVFHPSQTLKDEPDGSLVVRFQAGGLWEMAWHLFRWGPWVDVIQPKALREHLVETLTETLNAHSRTTTRREETTGPVVAKT